MACAFRVTIVETERGTPKGESALTGQEGKLAGETTASATWLGKA